MNILHYVMAKFEVMRTMGRDERGVTAMEYALIAALVAIVLIGILGTLGNTLIAKFTTINTALGGAAPAK